MFRLIFLSTLCLLTPITGTANAEGPPPVKIPFTGVATNVSLGLRDRVEMWITNPSEDIVQTGGTFAGEVLIGTFKAIGQAVEGCAERMVCLQFQGTLDGLEDGGFPEGVYTTWAMTMTIDPKGNAMATYSLGPLPSFVHDQNGMLDLKPAANQ